MKKQTPENKICKKCDKSISSFRLPPKTFNRSLITYSNSVNSNNFIKRSSGFTLVEVMIALSVMVMVFMGIFAVLLRSITLVELSRDETRTSQILQSEMENLRMKNWGEIENMELQSEWTPASEYTEAFADRYACMRYVTTSKADQRLIVLECTWVDSRGVSHNRNLLSLYTKEGINDYYYRSL